MTGCTLPAAFLPLVSLDTFRSLGFEVVWATTEQIGHERGRKQKRTGGMLSPLLQTPSTRFSQLTMWLKSLHCIPTIKGRKEGSCGLMNYMVLSHCSSINAASLYGKTHHQQHKKDTHHFKKVFKNHNNIQICTRVLTQAKGSLLWGAEHSQFPYTAAVLGDTKYLESSALCALKECSCVSKDMMQQDCKCLLFPDICICFAYSEFTSSLCWSHDVKELVVGFQIFPAYS